jgi:hypothetical protein
MLATMTRMSTVMVEVGEADFAVELPFDAYEAQEEAVERIVTALQTVSSFIRVHSTH